MADAVLNIRIRRYTQIVNRNSIMSSLKIIVLVSSLMSVKAQDLTSTPINHPKHFQPYNSYYSAGYYPNTKFKPGSSYKTIPPSYNPSDICFNPNYYGFYDTQTSPVPQPNIYYVPNTPQPASPSYPPSAWSLKNPQSWNNYPYIGNPATPFTSPAPSQIPNSMGLGLPRSNSLSTPNLRSSKDVEDVKHNETFEPANPIKITRPTISVKIVPPNFNENATSITNISPEPDTMVEKSQNTRLDEKTRKMIKKLLEMGSRLASRSNEHEKHSRASIDADQSENVKYQPSPRNEMVIQPNQRAPVDDIDNKYPLPKTTYGNTNEPKSSFNRMKILTEFNPPA